MQRGPGAPLDPVQILAAGLRNPAGFRTKKWAVAAMREQPGFENFSQARPETLESKQHRAAAKDAGVEVGTKKVKEAHPASGTVSGTVSRATQWLTDNIPSANHESPMWDFHFGSQSPSFADVRQKHADDIESDAETAGRTRHRPAKWVPSKMSPRAAETAERLKQQRADADKRTYGKREWTEMALGQALSWSGSGA